MKLLNIETKKSIIVLIMSFFFYESVIYAAQSDYLQISREGKDVVALDGRTQECRFKSHDPLEVIEWGMQNSDITVVGPGDFAITNAIFIPRPDISLIIDKGAKITRTDKGLRGMPYAHLHPVIYNGGHDNVTVMNMGVLKTYGRQTAIFYDGRNEGKFGIKGGRIIDTADYEKPTESHMQTAVYLVDCEDVAVPLVYGHGYRDFIQAEGCEGIKIGTVVAVPRLCGNPVVLSANKNTVIERLIASQITGQTGVLVKNSADTIVNEANLFGNPIKYVKTFNILYYGMTGMRFTKRPLLPDSEGSQALKVSVLNRKIKSWPLSAELMDFPGSLPNLKVKVGLSAIDVENNREEIIDRLYDLPLLSAEEFALAPEPVFISTGDKTVLAKGVRSGRTLFEDADAARTIEWALGHSPVTVLQKGVYTVDRAVVVPTNNVSLIVTEGAELRHNQDVVPPVMPGGRGNYRPLIHNPGHDNVNIVNMGILQAYQKEIRGVGIHFDGRSGGEIGIEGGMIFSTGEILADDVVWVVDARGVNIPVLIGRRYTNAPLALEGVEDTTIGVVAALAGRWARENEVIDFNSFCRKVHVELVIGTTPVEEAVDVNNSPDCVVDEIRVYRASDDVMPLEVSDWPDWWGGVPSLPSLMSQMPAMKSSTGSVLKHSTVDDRDVTEWIKTIEIEPLEKTLPQVKIKTSLKAVFADGTDAKVMDEGFVFNL